MPNATSDAIETALAQPHQSVSPRCKELRDDGYTDYAVDRYGVIVMEKTRRNRNAAVQTITKKGRDAVRLGIPIRRPRGDPTAGRHKHNPLSAAAYHGSDFSNLRLDILKHLAK